MHYFKYKLLADKSTTGLSEKVNEAFLNGWTLFEPHQSSITSNIDRDGRENVHYLFTQAMIWKHEYKECTGG